MAPIFFRQGSNNIKIGTVCQRQGGANPEMSELFMRQGAANRQVYQKAPGTNPYLFNCTTSYDDSGNMIITPIDPHTYYYAYLRGQGVSESQFVYFESMNPDAPSNGEWGQPSVMWGNIVPSTAIQTERPDPKTTLFSYYSTHATNCGGENYTTYYVNGKNMGVTDSWYPDGLRRTWQFDDPEYDYIFEFTLYDYNNDPLFTENIPGLIFDGAILVWCHPATMYGTPTVTAIKLGINGNAGSLTEWS